MAPQRSLPHRVTSPVGALLVERARLAPQVPEQQFDHHVRAERRGLGLTGVDDAWASDLGAAEAGRARVDAQPRRLARHETCVVVHGGLAQPVDRCVACCVRHLGRVDG
eukprot:CAMPEP_0180408252 /NCGR_PEP_ID=MMETSP0989-20121125/42172_1 /TAXON_ID=697907 /ORGANISM="non described non described, Strain CCMP2293" /LENGTH=108 /DNA_ID=CAMNT_0022412167 /DNA_START=40 /DNA_END=364 /DNA_ORIENTATION=-